MSVKKLAQLAMLISLYVVFSLISPIKLINFRLTFEAFPILVGGLLLGPGDGFLVGFIGSMVYQVLFSGYGFTPTTILWVLPHALSGYVVGWLGQKVNSNYDYKQCVVIAIISALLVTTLNSVVMYIDAKMYGYYTFSYVFGSIVYRYLAGIMLACVYSFVLPQLIERLKKLNIK